MIIQLQFLQFSICHIARPEEPYIQIQQCSQKQDLDTCVYEVNGNQEQIKLICSVIGAKPEVTLFWMVHGFETMTHHTTTETQELDDGTFTTTTIVEWVLKPSENITCVASGAAVDGQAELHVSFMVTSQQGTTKRYEYNQLCLLLIKMKII